MKNYLILFLFLISFINLTSGQSYKYAVIPQLNPDIPVFESDLKSIIESINANDEIKFVIVQNQVTLKTFEELLKPFYIFSEENMIINYENSLHIVLQSNTPGIQGAHYAPETVIMIKEMLDTLDSRKEIIFYTDKPLKEIDNYFRITNLFAENGKNVTAFPLGKREPNNSYNLIENKADSLIIYELTAANSSILSYQIKKDNYFTNVDSVDHLIYSSAIELWHENLNKSLSNSLLISGDKIYGASNDGMIFCYNISGNSEWEYQKYQNIMSRPALSGNILAAATTDGDILTINTDTGELIQVIGLGEAIISQPIIADINLNGRKTRGIIAGTENGQTYCYDLNYLELIWESNSINEGFYSLPLFYKNKLFIQSADNILYCLDANSGSLIWKYDKSAEQTNSSLFSQQVTDGKNIYMVVYGKSVCAVDLLLGTELWKKNLPATSIGINNDQSKLFFKTTDGKLQFLSAQNGKTLKLINYTKNSDYSLSHPIEWNNNIIFGTQEGMILLTDSLDNVKPAVFMGNSPVGLVYRIKDNIFAASNIDGKIIVFKIL